MPSANPSKLEKQASTEANEPIRQAITVIEHKIRNLEKRKGKLESYRDIQKAGKELDRDQKVAVAKYDEVLQTLEITRELYKQIVGIANDAAKQQKKLARKEALERTQQDISKVREVLLIQDTLIHMAGESIRESFLTGTNGAKKLNEEDIKALDDLYNEITPKRIPESGEAPFQQQLQKAAEHLVAVIDGKSRDVVGTTYAKIKTIVQTINQSEYFEYVSAAQEREESVETKTEESTERVSDAPVQCSGEFSAQEGSSIPQDENIPETSYQAPPIVALSGPLPPTILPQGISSTPGDAGAYYPNSTYVSIQPQPQTQQPQPPRINDVIGGTPNFFFLQESELDSPDVTSQQQQQQQIVSHIPPPVNPAAIPTQTYTNQNFTAVPVQVSPQQVIYTPHPPQDLSHIPGFANPNPPPPIPMPPSHQNNMQFSPQHPGDYPSQQAYDQQDPQPQGTGEQVENRPEESSSAAAAAAAAAEVEQSNESSDWAQMTDSNQIDEWVNTDVQSSGVQEHGQSQQQSWEQRTGGYRGRGGRRGNSNGYNGRGRGNYQQNGRGGQGSYYRNENSNYQNGGYQQRNYNNDGSNNGGYNGGGGGFKRDRGNGSGSGNGGSRGGPRNNGGERTGMDRGGRGSGGGGGGQYRGQRGGNRGGNSSGGGYIPRSKPQAQQ